MSKELPPKKKKTPEEEMYDQIIRAEELEAENQWNDWLQDNDKETGSEELEEE